MGALLGCFTLLVGPALAGLIIQDGVLAWGWAGIVAPASGAMLAGGLTQAKSLRARHLLLVAGVASGLLWLCLPALPHGISALAAWMGLVMAGLGLGLWAADGRVACASGLLFLGLGLALLPSLGGAWGAAPFSPALTARLLALSPATLVVEAGGVDWLRHPSVYDPAGGDSLGPGLYRPWGRLAGALPGVVGFLAGALWRGLQPKPTAP